VWAVHPNSSYHFSHSDALQKLSQGANGLPTMGYLNRDNDFGVGYTPVSMDEIPDFLDTKWAVV